MGSLEIFNTICSKCQTKRGYSTVHIHIDWNKRKYFFICLNEECGSIEAYNEKGERIVSKDKSEVNKKEKKEVN